MFWHKCPLLLYGLAFLIGVSFYPLLIFPALLLAYSCRQDRLILALLCGVAGFVWYQTGQTTPKVNPSTYCFQGKALLHVDSYTKKTAYGKARYDYRGIIKEFKSSDKIYKNIPVSLFLTEKAPPQDNDWEITGTLISKNGRWIFKVDKLAPWTKIEGTWSLAELRYRSKEKLKAWIQNSFPHKKAGILIAALATGDLDDRSLSTDFSKLGVSHLLAISGFHFAIIAAVLELLLKPFCSYKKRALILMSMMALTTLFLGGSPSVLRAFITLFIFLLAPLIQSQSRAENSLGAALLLILLIDPFSCFTIGFQFSFLATGGILLFFAPFDNTLKLMLPHRSRKDVYGLNYIERGGLIILTFLRRSLALNGAILLVSLPATLCFFHSFPWISLLYNLFFPFMVSISLFLLVISFFIPWLHPLNSYYTNFILTITEESPLFLHANLSTKMMTPEITLIILSITLYLGFLKKNTLNYT